VDIKSEEEKRQEIEAQMTALTSPGTPLSELKGVGPKTIEKIEAHGVSSIEKLADMTPEQLTAIPGIGEKMVERIQLAVAAHFQSIEQQQAAESGQPAGLEGQPGEAEQLASGEVAPEEPAEQSAAGEDAGATSEEAAPELSPDQATDQAPQAEASSEESVTGSEDQGVEPKEKSTGE
jgi:N utilization substance protein A